MFEIYSAPIYGEEVYKHLPRDAVGHVRDAIGYLRYINILAWFRGFRVKIANLFLLSLNSQKRLGYKKKTTPNIEV